MKHFGNQLDILFREKNIVQKKFAEKMGVTAVTVSKWKSVCSIDAETLERISLILNVPIDYWFDDAKHQKTVSANYGSAASINGNAIISGNDKHEINHLKDLLNEKNLIIEEKERTIQILINQLNTK